MGLNDVMARLGEQKASKPTPTEEKGVTFERHEYDRLVEALRIAIRSRIERLAIAKQFNATLTQTATLRQQITDYNQLIFKLRNETARLQSDSIR